MDSNRRSRCSRSQLTLLVAANADDTQRGSDRAGHDSWSLACLLTFVDPVNGTPEGDRISCSQWGRAPLERLFRRWWPWQAVGLALPGGQLALAAHSGCARRLASGT
jgi:hypothetical protein